MNISLLEWPDEQAWIECKRRALITIGKKPISCPDMKWRKKILQARHSPIRYFRFSFLLQDIPYCSSVHLCRHIHAQPYVKSQRNDRQSDYDRNKAQQDSPVDMIWDLNGESIQLVANKRLCNLADKTTKDIVEMMCWLVKQKCPEFEDVLVPMCEYHGGVCHEMFPCGRCRNEKDR